MTEQQLRDGLQTHLASADLPDSRKQALLATLWAEAPPAPTKGDAPMIKPSKFRTVLIAVLILTLLSATAAVAGTFSGYVNMKGEEVSAPVPAEIPEEIERLSQRKFDYYADSPTDQLTHVFYGDGSIDPGTMGGPSMTVDSLEELAALFPEETILPTTPEGFRFTFGNVNFSCAADSNYVLVRNETAPEGLTIHGYEVPEGKRVATLAAYNLKADDGSFIVVRVMLYVGAPSIYNVEDAERYISPDIPGMDEAILIVWPDKTTLNMRCKLKQPVSVVDHTPGKLGQEKELMQCNYQGIYITSSNVPADVLLSMVQ